MRNIAVAAPIPTVRMTDRDEAAPNWDLATDGGPEIKTSKRRRFALSCFGESLGLSSMRQRLRWAIIFLLGWSGGLRASAESKPDDLRLEARAAFHQGKYQETVVAAQAGLAALPSDESDAVVRAGLWQWAGVGANALGDHQRARECLETSLALYRGAGERREVAATLNSMAEVYSLSGDRAAQLRVLIEAHGIFEELGETMGRAALANSIGNYYADLGESAKALPWHEQSVALRRTMDNSLFLATGLENLGITFRETGDDDKARPIYREALALYRELEDEEGIAGMLTNLGVWAMDEGRWADALRDFHEALAVEEAADYKTGQAILLGYIGESLAKSGQSEASISWFDRALALAEEIEQPERIVSVRQRRAEALEAAGRPTEALADLRRMMALRAEIDQREKDAALLDLQTKFETVQNEREIERLKRVAVERDLGLSRSEAARMEAERAHAVERAQRRTTLAVACGAAGLAFVLAILFLVKRRTADRLARQRAELATALAELHTANADLKRLYARKSEWLGFAVHELRSPLFAIDGCCAEVVEGLVDSPLESVGEIRAAAARMRRELDAWLESERVEQDTVTLNVVASDWSELVVGVVAANQPVARAKQIKLAWAGGTDGRARLDPRRWREVVENLVSNAIKFSPIGSRVWVRTGQTEGELWLRVEDEGPGLTAQDRGRLFEAFTRLSAQPTGGETSTGLGLHWTKRLVEAHGGALVAEDRIGGGLILVVTVPMLAEVASV